MFFLMYAIVVCGGHQRVVSPGKVINLMRMPGASGTVELKDVLFVSNDDGSVIVGAPRIDDSYVKIDIIEHKRGPKKLVFKKKRRKSYRKMASARDLSTRARVVEVFAGGKSYGTEESRR